MLQTVSDGALVSRLIAANTTNATSVKAKPGKVLGWKLSNINAAVRYLKLYDLAAAPTVGTSTPKLTIAIPPASAECSVYLGEDGLAFATGIAFAVVTGLADSDTTAVAAAEIGINLFYI